ncbi:hypothetical protein F4805DRAFT_474762 [Annulohypoxylon moriforme]|nr:hypothetical protein F4805DRAFT_474762 [Annulohypoxylon moriforme]
MGNSISLDVGASSTPTSAPRVRQFLNKGKRSITPVDLGVAIENLKHALATFEDTQRMGQEPETFSMNFNREVKILTTGNEWILATALLDTQCHAGNWISRRLVDRLGKLSLISTNFVSPQVVEVSGRPVSACGVIDLDWKWHPNGTRNHTCQFHVLPDSDHLDVLFGVEYIISESLLQVNELALAPLVEYKKQKKDDKDVIEKAKERQRKEKEALEERRREQQKREQKDRGSAGQ